MSTALAVYGIDEYCGEPPLPEKDGRMTVADWIILRQRHNGMIAQLQCQQSRMNLRRLQTAMTAKHLIQTFPPDTDPRFWTATLAIQQTVCCGADERGLHFAPGSSVGIGNVLDDLMNQLIAIGPEAMPGEVDRIHRPANRRAPVRFIGEPDRRLKLTI